MTTKELLMTDTDKVPSKMVVLAVAVLVVLVASNRLISMISVIFLAPFLTFFQILVAEEIQKETVV